MLESGVNILRMLASQNRFNKDVMVELNVHGTIDKYEPMRTILMFE